MALSRGNDSIVGFNGVDTPIKWDSGNGLTEELKNYHLIQNEVPTTVDYETYQGTRELERWISNHYSERRGFRSNCGRVYH